MSEDLIRGLIGGSFVVMLGIVANLFWKLIRSRPEGARRLKIVSGIFFVLAIGIVLLDTFGPIGTLMTLIISVAIIWIIKGFTKQAAMRSMLDNQTAPTFQKGASDSKPATPPQRTIEVRSSSFTIINCPNCEGRLRVEEGKYVDVTCTHCRTIFRTHT